VPARIPLSRGHIIVQLSGLSSQRCSQSQQLLCSRCDAEVQPEIRCMLHDALKVLERQPIRIRVCLGSNLGQHLYGCRMRSVGGILS